MKGLTKVVLWVATVLLLSACASDGATPDLPSVNNQSQLQDANQAKLQAAVYQ